MASGDWQGEVMQWVGTIDDEKREYDFRELVNSSDVVEAETPQEAVEEYTEWLKEWAQTETKRYRGEEGGDIYLIVDDGWYIDYRKPGDDSGTVLHHEMMFTDSLEVYIEDEDGNAISEFYGREA